MAGRKMMSREVTSTVISLAMIEVVDGEPKMVQLPEEVIIGNVSMEFAQRLLNKKYGQPVTILEIVTDTQVYEMAVEDFIKHASVKVAEEV
jgi:hypothetical protein